VNFKTQVAGRLSKAPREPTLPLSEKKGIVTHGELDMLKGTLCLIAVYMDFCLEEPKNGKRRVKVMVLSSGRSRYFWTMVSPLNLQLFLMVCRCHKAKIMLSSMVKLQGLVVSH
jgi:hypothetical protein